MKLFSSIPTFEKLLKRNYPSFWLVNTLGWSLFVLVDTLLSPEIWNSTTRLISNALEWFPGFLITIGVRYVYKRYPYRKKTFFRVFILILVISQIAALLLLFGSHVVYYAIDQPAFDKYLKIILSFKYIAWRQSQLMPLMMTWSLLYFGMKFWFDWFNERERAEKADLLAQSTQLQMLRYQVNPHFLFNSFSSLRALIRTDQVKAEEMISKLSEFYRYSLIIRDNSEVRLIEELDAIAHYFDIEKIRFGEKIEFITNIEPIAEEYPIPGFLLHPLIENAIKYGMKTSPLPLQISIDATVDNQKLKIVVSNSGNWYIAGKEDALMGTGTGLKNVNDRLECLYPRNHSLKHYEANGYVIVEIEIFKELQ